MDGVARRAGEGIANACIGIQERMVNDAHSNGQCALGSWVSLNPLEPVFKWHSKCRTKLESPPHKPSHSCPWFQSLVEDADGWA